MSALSFSTKTAADASGLSQSHIKRAIALGHLKAKRSGPLDEKGNPTGKYVILAAELQAYIEGLVDA